MLSEIVRPLVDTQIRRLANSQATDLTLMETIAKWLSYLGVKARVTHLAHQSGRIQVSLTVGKPNSCASDDWQQILHNLDRQQSVSSLRAYDQILPSQRSKLQLLRWNHPWILTTLIVSRTSYQDHAPGSPTSPRRWHQSIAQRTVTPLGSGTWVTQIWLRFRSKTFVWVRSANSTFWTTRGCCC